MSEHIDELIAKAQELQDLAYQTNQLSTPHSEEDYIAGDLYQSLSTWLGKVRSCTR